MKSRFVSLAALAFALSTSAEAQQSAPQRPADTEDVEVEPITCWWRTTTSAVRTGEPFGLTLTCSVVETESTRIVPDQSRLDAAVVQLPPFEILGGSHAGDLRTPGKRFFQYDYRLRVIAEGTFGADVMIPPLEISYRVESQVSNGESVQGRDQTYTLPRAAIRVISLVPDETTDIREAPASLFTEIETRESRANLFQTLSAVLFTLAGVLLVMALVTLVRARTTKATVTRALLSDRAILRAVNRELTDIQRESRGGWSTELAGRALAALRIAGSYALGRKVGQRPIADGASALDGQLRVGRAFGGSRAFVSGSVTAQTVAGSNGIAESHVQGLADGLRTLTVMRYGRNGSMNADADEAVAAGLRIARQQASAHSLVSEWTKAVGQSIGNIRKRVWA
ncbi:MAG: hypothetical protein ACRD2N_12355 [Vicinamibacterales bacterium]